MDAMGNMVPENGPLEEIVFGNHDFQVFLFQILAVYIEIFFQKKTSYRVSIMLCCYAIIVHILTLVASNNNIKIGTSAEVNCN